MQTHFLAEILSFYQFTGNDLLFLFSLSLGNYGCNPKYIESQCPLCEAIARNEPSDLIGLFHLQLSCSYETPIPW